VFTTARAQSLRANNWRVREFNAGVKAANLNVPGLTPHKLRTLPHHWRSRPERT
jgi:hypothetical protein